MIMKQKKTSSRSSFILIGVFCLFVFGLALVSLILPKRTFSEAENRYLQEMPVISPDTILDGSFMKDAEDYTADHIAGRDQWVGLQARLIRLSGKGENNDAFFASEDTLIKRVKPESMGTLAKKIDVLNAFSQSVDVPVFFGLIPSAASIWSDRLPQGASATTMDEEKTIASLYQMCDQDHVTCLDLISKLKEHEKEEIYYRTDHHWTSLGAGYGCQTLIEAIDQWAEKDGDTDKVIYKWKYGYLEPVDPADYRAVTVSDSFYGTTWSSSGAHWVKPDHIDTYIQDQGGKMEVLSYAAPEGDPVPGSLYHDEKLEIKDKYTYFLGGNQPICTIRTGHEGPRILLVRDSYSDSLAPWLTERFSEITLVDFRYTRMSVSEYVAAHDYDCVLVLYGFSGFTTDRYMNLLK